MDAISDDPDARRAFLARWAAEQRRRLDEDGIAAPPRREPGRRGERALNVGAIRRERIRPSLALRPSDVVSIERKIKRLDRVFDRRLLDRGLDTFGNVYDIPEIAAVDGVHYVPSPWYVLPRALRVVGASDRDVLVDFGCGKGRIVHQAAKRPLKRVIGVEISPELAAFAQTLVAAHRREYRCQSVEIVACDAAQFQVPDDLTIAYLFQPFRGKTLGAVLRNIIESIDSCPRPVHLIYVWPDCAPEVLATGRFQMVFGMDRPRSWWPPANWPNEAAIFKSCG